MSRRRGLSTVLAIAALAAAVLGGRHSLSTSPASAEAHPRTSTAGPAAATQANPGLPALQARGPISVHNARAALARLHVLATRPHHSGYERGCGRGQACSFGPAWTDDSTAPGSHNGCGTRDDILRQSLTHLERWWRLLTLIDVTWDRVSRAEVELMVGWMRHAHNAQRDRRRDTATPAGSLNLRTGKPALRRGDPRVHDVAAAMIDRPVDIDEWPVEPDIVERASIRSCVRRGAAIDLIFDRGRENRSQIVFTTVCGRDAAFWQSPRTRKQARPSVTTPTARAAGISSLTIVIDTREQYAWRFAAQQVSTVKRALPCGDYGIKLRYAIGDLAALPRSAIVVEDRYSQVFKLDSVCPAVVADGLAELQIRWPSVPIVFCETRPLSEEWTYRYLAAAHAWAETEQTITTRIGLPVEADQSCGGASAGGGGGAVQPALGELSRPTPNRRPRRSARGPAEPGSPYPIAADSTPTFGKPGATRNPSRFRARHRATR